MAQKRTRDFSNVKTFNLFSAFSADGKMKSACKSSLQDMESDEEEDLEDLQAKMQKKSTSRGRKGKEKRKGRSRYMDSDDDDDDVKVLPRNKESSDQSHYLDSPSPPPPPEFDKRTVMEIMDKNKNAAKVIQNLELTMRTYQMSKAQAAMMEGISPTLSSPNKFYDLDAPVSRDTITVKVRSRTGLLRFEHYQMDATFEHIFRELGGREGVDASLVRMTRKGEDISEMDTPRGISLHVADILDYVVVDGTAPAFLSYSLLDEDDFVIIRLRTSEKNSGTRRRVPKMEPLHKVFEEFATAIAKPLKKLQFLFDGDPISVQDTPQSLQMDEENCIDVEILP